MGRSSRSSSVMPPAPASPPWQPLLQAALTPAMLHQRLLQDTTTSSFSLCPPPSWEQGMAPCPSPPAWLRTGHLVTAAPYLFMLKRQSQRRMGHIFAQRIPVPERILVILWFSPHLWRPLSPQTLSLLDPQTNSLFDEGIVLVAQMVRI